MASAARFLIDGQEEDAANVLLSCSLDVWESGDTWRNGDEVLFALHVELSGPRASHEILSQSENETTKRIRAALGAVLPTYTYMKHFNVAVELVDIDPDWRTELLELARGKSVNNQGLPFENRPPLLTWKNLKFRSSSERRIAETLDRTGVLFLPNCMARLGDKTSRKNREAATLESLSLRTLTHCQHWMCRSCSSTSHVPDSTCLTGQGKHHWSHLRLN